MKVYIREIQTQLNAFDIYSLFNGEQDLIFLDSSKDNNKLGRYSYIGINPFKRISYKDGVLRVNGAIVASNPFDYLNQILEKFKVTNETEIPFIGGCMGYLAYDLVRDLENLPDLAKDIVDIPTIYFVFYDNVIIYDHHKDKVYISELNRLSSKPQHVDQIENIISDGAEVVYDDLKEEKVTFTSSFTENSYMNTVDKIKQYIKTGDIYIVNMTHTYLANTTRKAYDIYKILRKFNQAPFSAYMPLEGFEIMCSSPECFMSIKKGEVETRPIKGTRTRSNISIEDEKNRIELEQSEKDRAELLMIVDLERNDLSKVCKPYTVKVTELFKIESYSTVHHLVSTVVGKLRSDKTAVDCIKECFPGGSITGAPKIRAMEIIEELEPTRRNIYTGCIGYFGFDGDANFNIAIRSILKKENQLSIGVGGGITWESEPKAEYNETLDKAQALFSAIRTQEVNA